VATGSLKALRRRGAAIADTLDQRWVHFLLIALLVSWVAAWLAPGLRAMLQLDQAVQDQCLQVGRPRPSGKEAPSPPGAASIYVVYAPRPLPRPVIAQLVLRLRAARAVILDYRFADREAGLTDDERVWLAPHIRQWRSEDRALAIAIREADNVVVGAWQIPAVGSATGESG
jgi:hypothetical protein